MSLIEILCRVHELEIIVENRRTCKEFAAGYQMLLQEVETLGMSTHKIELLKLLTELQARQRAYLHGTPPHLGAILPSQMHDPLTGMADRSARNEAFPSKNRTNVQKSEVII